MLERSLVLIKPDAMKRGLSTTILSRLETKGLKLVGLRMLHIDKAMAERHYSVHSEKPFFGELIEFITSTPIVAAVFEGENAVENIRKLMGNTNPAKADVGTIRRDFGLDIQQNATHSSDSVETAKKEISLFFKANEVFDY